MTGDNKSSASDSASEFDLSNPEAGVATDDDELFVSKCHNKAVQEISNSPVSSRI